MPATSQSVESEKQLLPKISKEKLNEKRGEFKDSIKKADKYIKRYRTMFRKIKNLDNNEWKKLLSLKQDDVLSECITEHRTGMSEMGRLLENLRKERTTKQETPKGTQ